MDKLSNKSVVAQSLNAFRKADLASILKIFPPECLIVSVREGDRKGGQLHGSYRTRKQAKNFLTNIIDLFDTKEFHVETIMDSEKNVVYANGTFTHKVKATGKLFYSTWVQRCIIQEGMIKEYRFYEDSAAYEKAAV